MTKINKKGISLAELLAVVVIMGILAAIAIPLVGNVIENSRKSAAYADAVTLKDAANLYCTELQEGCEVGTSLTSTQLGDYVSISFTDMNYTAPVASPETDGTIETVADGTKQGIVIITDDYTFSVAVRENGYLYYGNPADGNKDDVNTLSADDVASTITIDQDYAVAAGTPITGLAS